MTDGVAITGVGIEVPGLGDMAGLLECQPLPETRPFEPARKLGRKGLLYKDDATKLALCAVHDALTRAGLPVRELHASAPTGVVASSNLGNLDTVCRIIDTLSAGSAGDLSPMDAPNASSNVIASSIAIRFGCRAINLMLCNGATSGVDALFVAANALKARRAERMIVVGVEPRNEFLQQLVTASLKGRGESLAGLQLGEGAACVILETLPAARQRHATISGVIGGYAYFHSPFSTHAPARPDFWFTPNQAWPAMRALSEQLRDWWETNPPSCDLCSSLGELYGALGIFQCVAASLWLDQQTAGGDTMRGLTVLTTAGGSWGDGVASLMIRRPA